MQPVSLDQEECVTNIPFPFSSIVHFHVTHTSYYPNAALPCSSLASLQSLTSHFPFKRAQGNLPSLVTTTTTTI
jgi:hypothetical protein